MGLFGDPFDRLETDSRSNVLLVWTLYAVVFYGLEEVQLVDCLTGESLDIMKPETCHTVSKPLASSPAG